MAAAEEKISKASVGEDRMDLHRYKTNNLGYHNQYARNMLQVNHEGKAFNEMGIISGVAETDWSWSALFADYNLDGDQDLFITNGIPHRPNNLDYINFIHNEEVKKQLAQKADDQVAMNAMPTGDVPNYLFLGDDDIGFVELATRSISDKRSCSNGAAYADLDLDGDLELIVNNINQKAFIYENMTDSKAFLNIRLKSRGQNSLAIGAKVMLYQEARTQYKQLNPTKGFMSSVDYTLSFGLGGQKVDSIKITWPDNSVQTIIDSISTGTIIDIHQSDSRSLVYPSANSRPTSTTVFKSVDNNLGISYNHTKNSFSDYNTQKLIPYGISGKDLQWPLGILIMTALRIFS